MTPIEKFMKALAPLVQPDRVEDAAIALKAMIPMLQDIPERIWHSRDALDSICAAKRRTIIPSLADIRSAALTWLRDHPDRLAIADDRKADWSAEDRAWLAYWHRRLAAGFGEDSPFSASSREHCLSLLRRQAPKVAEYVLS